MGCKMSTYLREVALKDANLILEWINDPLDRKNSINQKPILYDEHIEWLKNALKDNNKYLYIMMIDDVPVGHIKLNLNNGTADIGYCIAPEYRGKGLGKRIIELVIDEAKKNDKILRLSAAVKKTNIQSVKVFRHTKFTEESLSEELLYFSFDLLSF